MKSFLLIFIIVFSISYSNAGSNVVFSKKDIKLLSQNNIERFVRLAGSETNAIERIINFYLPDTFYNDCEKFLWYRDYIPSFSKIDNYTSRKLQGFYWILKIYHSDYYSKKINDCECCEFLDDFGDVIWDYKDLDLAEKRHYYGAVLWSPVRPKNYYNKLGYIHIQNDSYKKLDSSFRSWFNKVKIYGLQYMRENEIPPIKDNEYRYVKCTIKYSKKNKNLKKAKRKRNRISRGKIKYSKK